MKHRLLWLSLAMSIVLNVVLAMGSTGLRWRVQASENPPAAGASLSKASSTMDRFQGAVEVNFQTHQAVNDLIQLIDHDHKIVCYGKTSPGGASTISCQHF